MKRNNRASNIELLRILCMIAIILYHNAVWGGYSFSSVSLNKISLDALSMCGKVAVNIFGIISGFYSKRENKLYKGLRIGKQTVLTSWIFLAIYLLINITIDREVGFGQIIQCVFPILLGQYWFVSAFILVLLFSPYIDKCVDNFSDKEIKGFIVLTFLVWCLISRLPFQSNMQYGWNQYLWLVYMYFIGRILNRYEAVWLKYRRKILFVSIVSFFILEGSSIGLNLAGLIDTRFSLHAIDLRVGNSVISVIVSISTFCVFYSLKIKHNMVINRVAESAFSVYLLHENILLRPFLWGFIRYGLELVGYRAAMLYWLLCAGVIYFLGTVFYFLLNKLLTPLCTKTELFERKLCDVIGEWMYD